MEPLLLAPDPVRRRLALPHGLHEIASLRVRASFRLERAPFEKAARSVIGGIEALRLGIEQLPGISSPSLTLGEVPEVHFVWLDEPDPLCLMPDTPALSEGNARIALQVEPRATGQWAITLFAPAYRVDRRSLEIVMERILDQITGRSRDGVHAPSYLEAAEWIRNLIQSAEGTPGRLHWRRELRHQTPGGGALEPSGNLSGAVVSEVQFQTAVPERFLHLAAAHREAWAALSWLWVARVLSGQPSLMLGCLADGRFDEELRAMVGPLSRFVPFGIDEPKLSCEEAADRAGASLAEGRRWQELFLLEDLSAEDTERETTTFFPYVFEYRADSGAASPARIEYVNADPEPYGVSLQCEELQGGMRVRLRSRLAAVTSPELDLLYERWLAVFEKSLESAARSFEGIDILTSREHNALRMCGPQSPVDGTMHEVLACTCQQYADRIAISSKDGELSFEELDSLANGVASLLPPLPPEAVIAVHASRSPASLVAIFAILKSGAAFLPLPPGAPEAHRRRLLKQSGAALLMHDQQSGMIEDTVCEVFDLQAAIAALRQLPMSARKGPPVHSDQLAYVLFTSGSSDQPLPVAVSHRSVLNLWRGLNQAVPELREWRRVGMNGPLSFDTSIKQLIQLLNGNTIVLIPEDARADPPRLHAHLIEQEIEVVDFTPSHLELVLDAVAPCHLQLPKVILLGGEAPAAHLTDRLKGHRLYNLYGLTECTVDSLVGPIDASQSPATLGSPIQNIEVFLVGRRMQPVPDGLTGNLIIAGVGIARGYFENPAQTADLFTPHPYEKGARAFRTGDQVTRNSTGSLEYRGRQRKFVKVRGHRVSPAEVQAALEAIPGVAVGVVASARSATGLERLVAWVLPLPSHAPVVLGRPRHTVKDLSVAALNPHETTFLYGEIFERNAYLRHGLNLGQGACVFDAGANIGLFSIHAHLLSPGADIFAFEPNPEAYECLLANVSIFGLSGHFFPVALGNQRDSARFTSYEGFSLLSGFHVDPETDRSVVEEYIRQQRPQTSAMDKVLLEELLTHRFKSSIEQREVWTISGVIREHQVQKIDLLKVNVEKSEANVLAGIEPEDWPKIQQVVLEVHDLEGSLNRIRGVLESRGFVVTIEKDWSLPAVDSINYYVYASRQPVVQNPTSSSSAAYLLPLPLTETGVKSALATSCTEYQIPSRVMILDRLPLTAHGKVDQAALDEMLLAAESAETLASPPSTLLESQLLTGWKDILGRRDLGIDTHFLEAGGDSFSIIQFNSRLRRELGLDLPVVDMFRHSSVRLLAQHLEGMKHTGDHR